jgi:hypothetical protein
LRAVAIGLTWYVSKSPPAYLTVVSAVNTICGELKRANARTVQINTGEGFQTVAVRRLTSLRLVNTCGLPLVRR